MPLAVVVAVAIVASTAYVVSHLTQMENDEPSLLALTPSTPEAPVVGPPAEVEPPPPAAPQPTAAPEASGAPEERPAPIKARAPAALRATPPAKLPWHSGVVVGVPNEIDAWEGFRGRPVDVVHTFAGRDTWEEIETAGWIMGYYADFPGLLVISQPFWPEGSGGSLGECASGAYDAHWANYGSTLTAAGRTDAYTRLAWEFNGSWFEWSATDVGLWKECFRKVVHAVRSTAPDARFEWNMNAHGSSTSDGNAWNSYPGDDVVDVVGIDAYDHYPSSPTAAAFDAQCTGREGLCSVIDFAREHGKQVGVGEWGVIGGGGGGGDNPLYIEKMFETFIAGGDVLLYETYFNEDKYGNALHAPVQNPLSSEVYRALFGR